MSFLVRWANNKIPSRQKWSCRLQMESWVTQSTRLFMTQALVIFLATLWPPIPSKNTYLDIHTCKCTSLFLKSVLQPYSVLLFSHVLIYLMSLIYLSILSRCIVPVFLLFELRERGQVLVHVILVLPEIHGLLITTCVLYNFGLWIHFKWGFICEKFCALFPELRFCPSRTILLLFLTDIMEILSVWDPYVEFLAWRFLNNYLV